MALTNGSIGSRKEHSDIISKQYKDASATTHNAYRVLTIDTVNGDEYVVEATSAATLPLGVSQTKVETVTADLVKPVDIQVGGSVGLVSLSGTCSYGDPLQATTGGQVTAASATGFTVGFALKTGATGEVIPYVPSVVVLP